MNAVAPKYQIYKKLADLNELPTERAYAALLDCCGSTDWARRMTEKRPYVLLEDLFETSQRIWFSLSKADWLEAYTAHPKIGSTTRAKRASEVSAAWSAGEQATVADASNDVLGQLAEANSLYEKKFGFIFIVFAQGKTAEEMLAICQARYGNSVETELHLAAEEQHKITELRLARMLEK